MPIRAKQTRLARPRVKELERMLLSREIQFLLRLSKGQAPHLLKEPVPKSIKTNLGAKLLAAINLPMLTIGPTHQLPPKRQEQRIRDTVRAVTITIKVFPELHR